MSSFPLNCDLYEANGSTYRRTPYRGEATHMNTLPAGGDTADLYADDSQDDGPACGLGEFPAESEVVQPKPANPNTSLAPPPGFDRLTIPAPAKTAAGLGAADPRVKQEGEKRWTASIEVPKNLHGLLIGPKHTTKTEMEKATQCRIIFPARHDTITKTIRISSAAGAESVARCLDRIEAVVISGQKTGRISKDPTHFAAIPCNYGCVIDQFRTFKDMVMTCDELDDSLKNEALFASHNKLHLTICMLHLDTDEDKASAKQIMAEMSKKYGERDQLAVEIEKLDIMNDDPSSVHVLFAKVHGSYLQDMVDDVRAAYVKAGLVVRDNKDEHVKLHMTVMNSRYAPVSEENKGPEYTGYKNRKTFDAEALMKYHPNFHFGVFIVDRMDICTRYTEDKETGYYECLVSEKVREID
ncbi:hypothetical protein PMAYCL1PPCAC_04968 [Pristionchus mayeri]|uniref:K Homology domain-containing protein n=1 Tax=Pristionchus mayeri TaxID=1317129 RepID=A0AAN5C2P9_9BILA|nr:hypothetical protein PMAYCL1PPCAC_04968 [Pristionchus mayeri]